MNEVASGKAKVLEPDDWPFHTQDTILAFCLYMAGVPFYDQRHPCVCEYNLTILRDLKAQGLPIGGLPIEEAVDVAVQRKKKGRTDYGFRRVPELKGLVGAYQSQATRIKDGAGSAAEMELQLTDELVTRRITPSEFLLRLNCVSLKMRVQFVDMWSDHVFIRIDNDGDPSITAFHDTDRQGKQREGRAVKTSGFKIYPRHASKELRQKMGL